MDRLTKFLLKDILNGGGIGFAFRFFHDLPDQEAESFGFTGAVVGLGLLGFGFLKDAVDDCCEGVSVVFLEEVEFFGEGAGIFVLHFLSEEFEENFFSGGGAEFMVFVHSDEVEKLSSGGEGVI